MMNSKKIQIIALATLVVAGIALAIIFGGKGTEGTRRQPAKAKPGTDSILVQTPQLSAFGPQQKKDLAQIHTALQAWEQNYRAGAGLSLQAEALTSKLENFLTDEPPYDGRFSQGTMIHLLGDYLGRLDRSKITDAVDLEHKKQLRAYHNQLINAPDPVTVTIVNRSGSPVKYLDGALPSGGSTRARSTSRRLGNFAANEGSFNFGGLAFPFNTGLKPATWNISKYSWEQTGRSSYQLTILP
jgi:hypothetical protein